MKKFVILVLALMLLFSVGCAPASGELRDGQYTIEVSLTGGSGRASVSSPAEVTMSNGKITATIVWSSSNYDLMLVDGEQYLPLNTEGNSTFEIPIASLDQEIAVSAETTAMSQPHMIDYTLRFDSATLLAAGEVQTVWIFLAAACTLAIMVIVVVVIKKNSRKRSIRHEA